MRPPLRCCPDGGSCGYWLAPRPAQCFAFCKRQKIKTSTHDKPSIWERLYMLRYYRGLRAPRDLSRDGVVSLAVQRAIDRYRPHYGNKVVDQMVTNWLNNREYFSHYVSGIRREYGYASARPDVGPEDLTDDEILDHVRRLTRGTLIVRTVA